MVNVKFVTKFTYHLGSGLQLRWKARLPVYPDDFSDNQFASSEISSFVPGEAVNPDQEVRRCMLSKTDLTTQTSGQQGSSSFRMVNYVFHADLKKNRSGTC